MRHPVRSITKRRCDPFKEGSRDEGEVKEGHSRSFAHKSNNGVIFHAGFVPVVSPSQLFASEAEVFTQAIHEGGRRTNTLISLPVHSPSHLHSSHISASILIHTLPSLLPPSRPLSSANRIYTHIYSFVRVVTTHPRAYTHIHREEVELPPPSARAHIQQLPRTRTHRGRRIRAHVPTRVLRHISKRGARCMRGGGGG